jgi:hypothetical protein
MTVMRRYFESGPWPQVRPAPGLLTAQPGETDAPRFVAIGQTDDRAWTIAYTPGGDPIALSAQAVPASASPRWFNPRTGAWLAADSKPTEGGGVEFQPPDTSDWVLDIRASTPRSETMP